MAPAPTRTANRPIANPSKTRYFKGKAPEAAPESDSEEESEDDNVQLTKPKFKAVSKPPPVDESLVAGGAGRIVPDGGVLGKVGMKMDLGGAQIGQGRDVVKRPG